MEIRFFGSGMGWLFGAALSFFCVLGAVLPPAQAAPRDPCPLSGTRGGWLEWADCQMEREDWSRATKGFRNAVSESPSDPEAQLGLVDALIRSGEYGEAQREIDRLARLIGPGDPDVAFWQKQLDERSRHAFFYLKLEGLAERSEGSTLWQDTGGQLEARLTWRWWKDEGSRFSTALKASGSMYKDTPSYNLEVLTLQNKLVFSPDPDLEATFELSFKDVRYDYQYYQDSIVTSVEVERFFAGNWSIAPAFSYTQYVTSNVSWIVSPSLSLNFDSGDWSFWAGAGASLGRGDDPILVGSPAVLASGSLFSNFTGRGPFAGVDWKPERAWTLSASIYRQDYVYGGMSTLGGRSISDRVDGGAGVTLAAWRELGGSGWKIGGSFSRATNTSTGASELSTSAYDPTYYNYTRQTLTLGVSGGF